MKISELKGRAVVDINGSRKMGELSDILIDPESRKPVSIEVKSGLFSKAQTVPASQVRSVGPDAITVTGTGMSTGVATSTMPGDQARVPDLNFDAQTGAPLTAPLTSSSTPAAAITLSSLLGDKVITDTGTLVGEVQDVLVDPATLAVTGYEVRGGGFFAKAQDIMITPEVRHGERLITVPASLLNQPG